MWTPMLDTDGVPCARHPISQIAARMDGELLDPVMQFTGLLDKNGVEVYEGDRVSDHIGVGVVEYKEKYAGFRVNYGDGSAKWFYDYNLKGEKESIEVIGNIYETV